MKKGYFPLHRKIVNNILWREKRIFSKFEAWLDILLEVRYKKEPEKIIIKMREITCNYGESLNSLDTWANRWGWSKSKVVRFFEYLRNNRKIETHNETHTIRLTVLNYAYYNDRRNANEIIMESEQNPNKTHSEPEEKRKNEKNDKINTLVGFDEWYSLYPKKIAKTAAIKAWQHKNNKCYENYELIILALELQLSDKYYFDYSEKKKFIPHPATYINRHSWEDEVQVVETEADTKPKEIWKWCTICKGKKYVLPNNTICPACGNEMMIEWTGQTI